MLHVQADPVSRLAASALVACALAACDARRALPPAPAAAATADEARHALRLRAHLEATPGVRAASVLVAVPPVDPLARSPARPPARVSIVVATGPGADAAVIGDVALAAARAALGPDVDAAVQLAPTPAAPRLARVGPFEVAPGTRPLLVATLALALLVIGGLAAALFRAVYRRGTSPHQSSTSTTRGS